MTEQTINWTESTYEGVQYRTTETSMPGRSAQAHKRNPLFVGYVEVWQGGAWVAQGMQANQSPRGAAFGATEFTGLRPNEAAFKAARWLELQVRGGRIQAETDAPETCELCDGPGPLFTIHADDPDRIAVHCAGCIADPEAGAELLEGGPPMPTGRMHWTIFDISVCDECGAQNWYDEDQTTCPRCEGLGLANRTAWERYDAMIARGYR